MPNRKSIADEIDRLDEEIADLQRDKAQIFAAYRELLDKEGFAKSRIKIEVGALKAAIRRRRELADDIEVATTRDALIDEIVDEISSALLGTSNAPRARARETGETRERA